MNAKLNRLVACTAAALSVAFAGAALANSTAKEKTTTSATSTTTTTTPSVTTTAGPDTRFNALNGAQVRDSTGSTVGMVQSIDVSSGQAVATISNVNGTTTQVPLGASDLLVSELPSTGAPIVTLNADGSVQHPIGSASVTSTTSTTNTSNLNGTSSGMTTNGAANLNGSSTTTTTTSSTTVKPKSNMPPK